MADMKISLSSLMQASEIRQQVISKNQNGYIPSLFELARAIETNEQNNVETKTNQIKKQSSNINNAVVQWVKNQISMLKADEEVSSQSVPETSIEQTEMSEEAQSSIETNFKTNEASDVTNRIFKQVKDLNLSGVKVEIVKPFE